MDSAPLLAQLDDLIRQVEPRIVQTDVLYGDHFDGSEAESRGMLTRLDAAIGRLAADGSVYRAQASNVMTRQEADDRKVAWLLGVVQALRADIDAGYVRTLEELIHADVFSDFLDMAAELQRSGYKDAAAVIAGSVLEGHLRKLAGRHGVATTKTNGAPAKADTLNADLAKAGAYNALVQKQVTAWLDLRNKAAHGRYGDYDQAQVAAFVSSVLDFAAKHPA